jgi:hypothetical protein
VLKPIGNFVVKVGSVIKQGIAKVGQFFAYIGRGLRDVWNALWDNQRNVSEGGAAHPT